MATVYIPADCKTDVETLAKFSAPYSKKPIFATNMDLFVFAAMVGYSLDSELLDDTFDKGNEIPESVFHNNNMDGVTYLLAIDKAQSAEILRKENDHDCWKVIEKYAAIGFREINTWILDNPGLTDFTDVLLTKIKQKAVRLKGNVGGIDVTEVSF